MSRCLDPSCTDGPPLSDEDTERRPRITADEDGLCTRCLAALERRIAEAPARRDLLRSILAGGSRPASDGSKPTKGSPPLPLNVDAHDLLVEQQGILVSWVQLVCAERDLVGPGSSDVRHLAPWLLGWLPWLVTQTFVGDLAEEVRDLSRRADGLTRHKERWQRLAAPCPECGAAELGRWEGADEVACLSCGLTWDEDGYRGVVMAEVDSRTVTAAQAAVRLGVDAALFRKWVSRGHIARVGVDSEGQHRYDVEDVDDMQRDGAA